MGQMSTHRQAKLRRTSVTPAPRDGFSLLELLAVISIMALLSTLAVTSYFSAVRGMAFRSAKRHFENALVQARQRACMDGVRVSVMAFNEVVSYDTGGKQITDTAACYVVCKEIGRFSFISGADYFVDEFADLEKLFAAPVDAKGKPLSLSGDDFFNAGLLRLYNLDQGSWTHVRPYAEQKTFGGNSTLLYSGGTHMFKAYAFVKDSKGTASTGATKWEVGDAYGVEVAPVQSLPKKYLFKDLDKDNVKKVLCVTFEPDGSCKSSPSSFTIQNTVPGGKAITFKVDSNGKITVPN